MSNVKRIRLNPIRPRPVPRRLRPKVSNPGTGPASTLQRYNRFINFYFAMGQNATRAAVAAGYAPGTNATTHGWHLLHRVAYVREEVERRRKELADKAELSAIEVLRSLARALRFDPRRLYNDDGTMRSLPELEDDIALELHGVEFSGTRMTKVKFPNKDVVRDQAMKHFGMYAREGKPDEDSEAPAPVSITIEYKDARLRTPEQEG